MFATEKSFSILFITKKQVAKRKCRNVLFSMFAILIFVIKGKKRKETSHQIRRSREGRREVGWERGAWEAVFFS